MDDCLFFAFVILLNFLQFNILGLGLLKYLIMQLLPWQKTSSGAQKGLGNFFEIFLKIFFFPFNFKKIFL